MSSYDDNIIGTFSQNHKRLYVIHLKKTLYLLLIIMMNFVLADRLLTKEITRLTKLNPTCKMDFFSNIINYIMINIFKCLMEKKRMK